MSGVDKKWFVKELMTCGALKHGEFRLASGRKSDYYIDIKAAITRPILLRAIAKGMAPYSSEYDRIAGVELGAVPVAAAVSLETGIPYIMVRKERKEHGTQNPFEGEMTRGDRVLFVEDVVTTGGTLGRSITSLRESGAVVDKVVCVVDREEGGREYLEGIGVSLHSLLTGEDLLAGAQDSK